MPRPADPLKPEFYVYRFELDGYPFYVGIGRAARASDRLRYVKWLLKSHNRAKLARSSLSVRVMASLLRRHRELKLKMLRRNLTRVDALELERKVIARLLARGYVLANRQQNRQGLRDQRQVVRAILSGKPQRSTESAR